MAKPIARSTMRMGVRACTGVLLAVLPLAATHAQTYTQTEEITYHDNTAKWVLGQVAQRKVNGTVAYAATFNTSTAQPLTHAAFGKLQQTLTYHLDGSVASVKDGNNQVTTLGNWYRGVPRAIGYPDGTAESAVVNERGWITSVIDENGFITDYAYEAMGRLASITPPSGDSVVWNNTTQVFERVASSEYGIPAGHWRQTISTGNARKITYFDAMWRPRVTREYDTGDVSGTQRFQRFTYDHEGRVTFASYPGTTDALSTGIWVEYDPLGRVTSVAQDSEHGLLITASAYLGGFQTRITNPRGAQTVTQYMAYDQPTLDWPVRIDQAVGQPEQVVTEIARDAHGKPTMLLRHDAAGSLSVARSYAYNAHQELCRTEEPETGATLLGHDAAGNLAWSAAGLPAGTACEASDTPIVAARRVDRTYDARNRLKALVFPDGKGNQTWAYAADGLPATVLADNGDGNLVTTHYAYNRRRLLTSERMQWGTVDWTIGYDYNANGHLASHSYPGSLTVGYSPNALGQAAQAGSFANGVSYYPNGAIKQFIYGNGIVHTMTQNARQLPARSLACTVANCSATTDKRLDLGYAFDLNANVSQITDGVDGQQTRGMAYDALDRLVHTTSNMFGSASYGYNALDNLTQVTVTGGGSARDNYYTYDGNNRLSNVRSGSPAGPTVVGLAYDAQGNLSNRNGQAHVFDYGNRLRSVTGKASYVYDGLGRRVRDVTTASKYSLYSQGGQIVYTSDLRRAVATQYVYLSGSLVAFRESPMAGGSATVRYQHTDALGTPIATTDANKAFVERFEYEPYGQQVNGVPKDGPGYTGHVQDAATGLTYMQQRYYDPSIGRFLSVDPVTAYEKPMSNFNRYAYANNNPYKFTDPDGRESACFSNGVGCGLRPYTDEDREKMKVAMGGLVGLTLFFVPDPTDALISGALARFGLTRVPAAYRVASEGGRHAGFLRQQLGKTPAQLQRTIRSIEKRIAEHQEKIKNPEKYMTRDDASIPANVERARKDWAGDISRQQEQRDIAKEVLRRVESCTGTRIKGNC